MKHTTISLLALLSLTTGCTTTASLSERMAAWQGQNVGEAIAIWGQPDAEQAYRDESVLIWHDHASQLLRVSATGEWTAAVVCERMLAVTDDGTITGWRWRGDSCPALHTSPSQIAVSHNVR